MADALKEQEYRDEARRLAQLPKAEQRAIVAWHRDIAADPKVKPADRKAAGDRAKVLQRLLKRGKKRKPKP